MIMIIPTRSGPHHQNSISKSSGTRKISKAGQSSTDAFAELCIGEDQLNGWKEYRRNNGEPDDPRLENISELYYYFYSIGTASIGISTFALFRKINLKCLNGSAMCLNWLIVDLWIFNKLKHKQGKRR